MLVCSSVQLPCNWKEFRKFCIRNVFYQLRYLLLTKVSVAIWSCVFNWPTLISWKVYSLDHILWRRVGWYWEIWYPKCVDDIDWIREVASIPNPQWKNILSTSPGNKSPLSYCPPSAWNNTFTVLKSILSTSPVNKSPLSYCPPSACSVHQAPRHLYMAHGGRAEVTILIRIFSLQCFLVSFR